MPRILIDREQFRNLCVNAGELSELALVQMAQEIDALPARAPMTAAPAPEEIEARLAEQFKHMNLAALDGLDWDPLRAAPRADASVEHSMEVSAPDGGLMKGRASTIGASDAASLRAQTDAAFPRLDQQSMAALLARLPPGLPLLTTVLSHEELAIWLEPYRSGDPSLGALIAKVRELTITAQGGL
jgi:hypothetical protein